MRVALGLEYDGSKFCGWQSQADRCGVQDALESALAAFLGTEVRVHCAGRTDAGVHALAQVVHIDTDISREDNSWVRGTNAHLPPGVRVVWAKHVADDFHARFSARSRGYQYVLLNDSVEGALTHNAVGFFHVSLDEHAMQQCANLLLGEHDFSSFRAAECQAKTPVKTLYQAEVLRRGRHIYFKFRANAFLHHMVRNIVGGLVSVGSARHSPQQFQEIFAARNRTLAAPTFSPAGLYLTDVEYDSAFGLPLLNELAQRHPFFSEFESKHA
jgi:tRNA pseudouridine38-40 synthase